MTKSDYEKLQAKLMARHKVKIEDAVVAIRLVEMSLRSCSNQTAVLNVLYESAPHDSQKDYLDYGKGVFF